MDLPRRHHANPRFYLSRWAGRDKEVCVMRVIGGEVKPRRYHPKNTDGFGTCTAPAACQRPNSEPRNAIPRPPRQQGRAGARQAGRQKPLDKEERREWTRFLLSLLFREPESVTLIKSHMADICREAINASEDEWARMRKPEETRPLIEAMADRQLAVAETRAEKIMREIIGQHRAEPDIMAMHWRCVDLRGSRTPLLTSDRPIVFLALSEPDSYIALPIGPYDLFIAAFDDRFERQFLTSGPSKMAWA